MQERSLVVSAAALAAVVLIAVGGLVLAGEARYRVLSGHDDHDREVPDGWLGVRVEEAVDHDEGGALVRSVVSDSPADEAGLRRGDIIIAVDGRAIRGPGSLTRRIRDFERGDVVNLTVVRDGREMTIDAELSDIGTTVEERIQLNLEGLDLQLENLGERLSELADLRIAGLESLEALEGLEGLQHLEHLEHLGNLDFDFEHLESLGEHFEHMGRVFVQRCENGECEEYRTYGDRPRLGVGLSDTTPELRRHFGGDDDAGALVDRVVSGSPAEEAGIRVGDLIVAIDGEPVLGASDIRRVLRGRDGERLRVEIVRDGSPRTLDLDLPRREEDDDHRFRGPRT